MVKEEKNMPEWKKHVPYEKSEAAHHEKHHEPAKPVKEAVKVPAKPVKEEARAPKEKMGAPVGKVIEKKEVRREAAPERMARVTEATCDACGRVHTESKQCEVFEYSGQKFHICGECIPPVHENPADFLAGKKGTASQSEDFDVCGPRK